MKIKNQLLKFIELIFPSVPRLHRGSYAKLSLIAVALLIVSGCLPTDGSDSGDSGNEPDASDTIVDAESNADGNNGGSTEDNNRYLIGSGNMILLALPQKLP